MNIFNRILSKANPIKNKKIVDSIPKNFQIQKVSIKNFFINVHNDSCFKSLNTKYQNIFNSNLLVNYSKFNMTSSKFIKIIYFIKHFNFKL